MADVDSSWDDFEEDLQKEYVNWGADTVPGEAIKGIIDQVTEEEGDYGPYTVIRLTSPDGFAYCYRAFGTVAANQMGRANPQPGQRIGIARLMDGENKLGKKYTNWRIIVREADGSAPVFVPSPVTSSDDSDEEPF